MSDAKTDAKIVARFAQLVSLVEATEQDPIRREACALVLRAFVGQHGRRLLVLALAGLKPPTGGRSNRKSR